MKKALDDSDPLIVKIISNDDDILKKIGQVLSSEKSRKIYSILIEYELNAKEVAKLVVNDENPRLPNIIFHLEKMVDCGMLSVQTKQQRKNGHFLKYYKAVPTVLVVPPQCLQKAHDSKSLNKIFENIFRVSSISIVFGMMMFADSGFFFNADLESKKFSKYLTA